MNSAMQDMLLNMILPKDQLEQMKRLLTAENIQATVNFVRKDYESLKQQLNRIEAQNAAILEALQNDNRSGGKRQLRAIATDNSIGDVARDAS